jgi:amidase
MPVSLPNFEELQRLAETCGFELGAGELERFRGLMGQRMEYLKELEGLPDYLPDVKYPREPGIRPEPEDNPYNAWCRKVVVKGAASGKLHGKRIALKDNIMLAQVPMMHGTWVMEGYVPEVDATVVTRILDAGGEIAGKAETECMSHGGGATSTHGEVVNPRKPGYATGGSSSGCAALVAAGEVDMAIGGDQGGSIRGPASLCGVYGMKPTFGLVPFTGVMQYEPTLDHIGPMSGTVHDNALLLEVIAGADGIDMRQENHPADAYVDAIEFGIEGLRIGVVKEGFGHAGGEPDVDVTVRKAIDILARLGADLHQISIPEHLQCGAIWAGIGPEAFAVDMVFAKGATMGLKGLYAPSLLAHLADWPARANTLVPGVKVDLLLGTYLHENHRGRFYGKAQNLRRKIRHAYEKALTSCDLLVMPTHPRKAQPYPRADTATNTQPDRVAPGSINTHAANLTGHPALSIPCGMSEDLPVGLMMMAKDYNEATIYRAARALEQFGDWRSF